MVQGPSWAADWFAASQEIPRISRNPNVHYSTHKRPPPVSILGQPNPVHMPTSHHLEIHPNIINPPTPRSPQWSLSLRFPHQDPIHPPLKTCYPSKKKSLFRLILEIIIIIIFLHVLGRLTCSGFDALPSFPGASTISSSSRFVVEGFLEVCSWGRVSGVWCCPFFQGGWSSFVWIWVSRLVFQRSPVLFLMTSLIFFIQPCVSRNIS